MAIPFLNHLDLRNVSELQNAILHKTTRASASHAAGKVIYESGDVYVSNGSAWINLSGDITRVNITAGTGLSGTVDTTSGEHTQTIDIANTGVTAGSYGSATAIPTFTVNAQGQLTAASSVTISTTLDIAADSGTDDGVRIGTDTLTISGTTNEISTSVSGDTITVALPDDVTIGNNLTVTNDLQVNGNVTLGNATSDTVTINGDLIVSGSQTTKVSETVLVEDNIITLNSNEAGTPSENSGIEVERGTATNVALRWNEGTDIWELTKDGSNYYEIQTVGESTYATSIGDGNATSYAVTHNLGTKDVIVQLYDVSSDETVHADVVRTSTSVVTIDFANAPATNDIRVLINKIG